MTTERLSVINEVKSFKTLFGLDLFDGWHIQIKDDNVEFETDFIKDLFEFYHRANIKKLVYLSECGTAFNKGIEEFEDLYRDFEQMHIDFTEYLKPYERKYRHNQLDETYQILIFGYNHLELLIDKIDGFSGSLCPDCMVNRMIIGANSMLNDIDKGHDRLYRIVAYYMLCADEYGMAKNILSILHAKYHSTLDLENIAFAHLYTCEQDGINPTESLQSMIDGVDSCQCRLISGNTYMEQENYQQAIEEFKKAIELHTIETSFSFHDFIVRYTLLENMESCYSMLEQQEYADKLSSERTKMFDNIKSHKGNTHNLAVSIGISSDILLSITEAFLCEFYEHFVDVE